MKNQLLIILFIPILCISQTKKEIAEQIETLLKENRYEEANSKLDYLIDNSNLNLAKEVPEYKLSDYGKEYFINKKIDISKTLNDYKTAILYAEKMVKMRGISNKHGLRLSKLYLKTNKLSNACDLLERMGQFTYNVNERGYDNHVQAMRLKDSLCNSDLTDKNLKEKKALNPHYGNQAPALSLLGAYQEDINNEILGKSSGKILEHRGNDSYDAYIYNTKWGEYRIAYKNSRVFLVWFYPIIKQKFNEDELWVGGKFNIENDDKFIFDNCTGNDEKGFVGNLNYYSIVYNCSSATHSITFYGEKDNFVTKVFIY